MSASACRDHLWAATRSTTNSTDRGGQRLVLRLVLDNRAGRDRHDEHTVRTVLGRRPRDTGLTYEHLDGTQEQLPWIADVIAWCYGAGGKLRRRITPAVAAVVDLDHP